MHLKNAHATDSKSLVLLKSSHADPDHHCLLQRLPKESLLSCLSASVAIIISTLPPLLGFMIFQGWDSVLLSLKSLRCFAPGLSQRQYLSIFILKWILFTVQPLEVTYTVRWHQAARQLGELEMGQPSQVGPRKWLRSWNWHDLCDTGSQCHGLGSPRGHKYFIDILFPFMYHFRLTGQSWLLIC